MARAFWNTAVSRLRWQRLKGFSKLLAPPAISVEGQRERLRFMERDVGVLVRVLVLGILYYHLFHSDWFEGLNTIGRMALETVRNFCLVYSFITAAAAVFYWCMDRVTFKWVQRVAFLVAVIDGVFIGVVTLATGGLESLAYWVFLTLMARNAFAFPVAKVQLTLNGLLILSYLSVGIMDQAYARFEQSMVESQEELAAHQLEAATRRGWQVAPGGNLVTAYSNAVAFYTNAHTRLTNAAASHARAMDRYREVALEARPGSPRHTNAALECVVTFDRYNRQHARYTAVFAQYRDAFTRLADQAYGPDGRPRPQQSNAPPRVEVERRFLVATNEFTLAFSTYTNALLRYSAQEELRPFAAAQRGRPRVEAERLEASPRSVYGVTEREHGAQYLLLRIALMLLLGACCYGLEALIDKQRLAFEEAREFEARQHQLKAAGRMAAQIAHQVKNPLAIINNAAWCLEQPASDANLPAEQARIIREEVRKADQIITRLMGYAQLAEGRVEKLVVAEELQRALAEVFPPGAGYPIQVETAVASDLPPLLMQRAHLSEILVNLLLNAREALNGPGRVRVTAAPGPDETVEIRVSDTGPGVPPERREKVFEPYFSTKEKGSGLGLAIVRNSAGMYGGTVRVESELGKGATFIVSLPIRTLMKSSP